MLLRVDAGIVQTTTPRDHDKRSTNIALNTKDLQASFLGEIPVYGGELPAHVFSKTEFLGYGGEFQADATELQTYPGELLEYAFSKDELLDYGSELETHCTELLAAPQ